MTRREKMKQAIEDAKKKSLATVATAGPFPGPADRGNAAKMPAIMSPKKAEKVPYEAKIGERPPCKERKAKARDARACARGNLPDGSAYECTYDAIKKEWHVRMIVAIPSGQLIPHFQIITHECRGLFQCLEELDLLYRKWLKENQVNSVQSGKEADQSAC